MKKFIDWLIHGEDGHVYLFQLPNIPIISWFLFLVAENFVTGKLDIVFSQLSFASLSIWCYIEITQGQSPFRRILGGVVAVLLFYNLFS